MEEEHLIPFTEEEIRGVNSRLSDDIPVKIYRDQHHRCYWLGFYILEELAIGHRYPHITFLVHKQTNGYYLTDYGYTWQTFKELIRIPLIKRYQKRLGIAYDPYKKCFYIQMPLLNSIEAYTHRFLELLTQIKTVADLKRHHLLK